VKIVNTDNHGGDYPDEKFLQVGDYPLGFSIYDKDYADRICAALNSHPAADNFPRFYKVVSDDYKLQPGFEP